MLYFRSNFEFEPWPYLNYQLKQLDLVTNQWLVSSFAQYHSKTKNNLKINKHKIQLFQITIIQKGYIAPNKLISYKLGSYWIP